MCKNKKKLSLVRRCSLVRLVDVTVLGLVGGAPGGGEHRAPIHLVRLPMLRC